MLLKILKVPTPEIGSTYSCDRTICVYVQRRLLIVFSKDYGDSYQPSPLLCEIVNKSGYGRPIRARTEVLAHPDVPALVC